MPTKLTNPVPASPTRDDIVRSVGEVDDSVVAEILKTGCTLADVELAQRWLTGEDETIGKEQRSLSPAAEAVYDILAADPILLEDRDR